MKKIEIEAVKEFLYYEKLENGLKVYMVPKNNMDNFYVSFSTKYGGYHTEFAPLNSKSMKKYPNGIAHFLEHKMFEQENDVDPFVFFSKTGTGCNAMTDYYHTSYLFYGNNGFKENLDYLLNFVQSPYFTDENVEKEKGIIEQEIYMYDDAPDRILFEKILFNMYKNEPVKYSVAGTVNDIKQITKEKLYDCYHTFYNPSNMFLVISGKFDVEETLNLIKENQSKKEFDIQKEIVKKEYKEPDQVAKLYEEKVMNVQIPYIAFGIKIPTNDLDFLPKIKMDLYFSILFQYLFSSTSLFYENCINEKIIDSVINIDMFHTEHHKVVLLSAKSIKYKELIEKIKENLKNIEIDDNYIEIKKKTFISSLIYSFEDTAEINMNISDSIIVYNQYYADMYSIIKSLNNEEFNKFIDKLNLNNFSIYIIK